MRSLQAKLVGAFVAITMVGLVVASGVFVLLRKDSAEQQVLTRVAALSPAVAEDLFAGRISGRPGPPVDVREMMRLAAERHGVRILFVDGEGNVVADSGEELLGQHLEGPPMPVGYGRGQRGPDAKAFEYWKTGSDSPGNGLTFISSGYAAQYFAGMFAPTTTDSTDDLSMVLAVPESSVSNAWRDLIPAILGSAAIALPVAVFLANLLARYITRPIRQLTAATHQLAAGSFNVDVPAGRSDEFGELARAFTTMASRVGASQAEMRSMVANVSHDLKTPLTSILGFSQAIKSGAVEGADSTHAGEVIHEEATRLSTRLDDILAVAEFDGGAAALDLDDLVFGELASRIVDRLTPMAEESGQTVHAWFERTAVVHADRARLERAIENLVVNAIRHAPKGSSISVTSGASEGRTWLELSNPAPGLDEAELPRLFERFYRHDRTRKRGGSGLGLPIANEVVRAHGGTLAATLANGTITMRLELPTVAV